MVCELEFNPIVEVKVLESLSYFISKFPLYFATTLLILLVPMPCVQDVFFEDTRFPFIYLGFLLQEFETLMITKFEFLVHIEKSIICRLFVTQIQLHFLKGYLTKPLYRVLL